MLKKHLFVATLGLALAAIAALPVSVTTTVAAGVNFDSCFNGQGSASTGMPVRTDFPFQGKELLLDFERYDSGNKVTVYGIYQGRATEKNSLGMYPYNYTPYLRSCPSEAALIKALNRAYPGYEVKLP